METFKIFLLPSEPVYSRIRELKSLLRQQIGDYFFWDYEPHISLVYLKLDQGERHLPKLTSLVNNQIKGVIPFDITLNKILAPGRGLIFVDVEKSIPLRTLTNQLHLEIRDFLKKESIAHQDFEKYLRHHITIGNYIKGEKYDKATRFLTNEKLPASFEANRIVVYKEDPATRKNHLIGEFGLTG